MSENSLFSADELLRLFLNAPSEAECAKFLDALIEKCVLPMIEKILRAKFGDAKNDAVFSEQDYEDLRGECGVKIVGVLRSRKNAAGDFPPIKDFSAYCAAIVYNVWNGFVREKSPNRENLKNRIRYALDKDLRFVVQADGVSLYQWREPNSVPSAMSVEHLTALVKEENGFFAPADLPDLLAVIFERANGSLTIETLVKIVADVWQVRDFPAVSLDDFHERAAPLFVWRADLEMRYKLEYLWREIRSLPVLQRVALLYNLRDERGGEMLWSFFNARLAALDELAEAMNLTRTQFVKLLPQLPLDDKKIAAAMNLTVKRIGDLRKTARDNLHRRLDGKAQRKSAAETAEIFTFIGDDEDDAAMTGEFLN
ncbi:MAG: hypothetical protein LH614_04230 [Pyrinomonadaceae bacterium]|nr:hypothetical protein [Pyrinomonadaceae bacterium]